MNVKDFKQYLKSRLDNTEILEIEEAVKLDVENLETLEVLEEDSV